MDFAQAVHELGRRRGWLLIGVLLAGLLSLMTAYDVRAVPPSLEPKQLAIGAGSTTLLVDTPKTALTNLNQDLRPLVARAEIFSRLATSRPVRRAIAQEVGVPEEALFLHVVGQEGLAGPQQNRERRLSTLLQQNRAYRVTFAATPGNVPTINVNTEAPRVRDAVTLADGTARAFRKYVQRLQRSQRAAQPLASQVRLRQLGQATGGQVAGEINRQLIAFTFVAVLVAWCLAMLAVIATRRNLQRIRQAEDEAMFQPGGEPAA